jgi:hypothetical protein
MIFRAIRTVLLIVAASVLLACTAEREPEPGYPLDVAVENGVEEPGDVDEPEATEGTEDEADEEPEGESAPADDAEEDMTEETDTGAEPAEDDDEAAEEAVPAKAPPADFAGPEKDLAEAVHQATANGTAVVLVDGPFPGKNRWQAEDWANGATVTLAPGGAAACLAGEEGPRGKWVASLNQPLDLSGYETLALLVRAEQDVAVAAGVWTGPEDGPHLFESKPRVVQAGAWQEVAVPLDGTGFKSAGSDWEFGTRLQDPDKTQRLSIFIYSEQPTTVCWRQVQLHAAD